MSELDELCGIFSVADVHPVGKEFIVLNELSIV